MRILDLQHKFNFNYASAKRLHEKYEALTTGGICNLTIQRSDWKLTEALHILMNEAGLKCRETSQLGNDVTFYAGDHL